MSITIRNREKRELQGAGLNVLVVDLDGTILKTDLLAEGIIKAIVSNPLICFMLPYWLFRGIARLKKEVALRIKLEVQDLSINPECLNFLSAERAKGRKLLLATAAHQSYADEVAKSLGLFDGVIGSDTENNKGRAKLQSVLAYMDHQEFSYIGNSWADLPLWLASQEAIFVEAPEGCLKRVVEAGIPTRILKEKPKPTLRTYLKLVRAHQWIKNILVFVPVIAGHKFLSLTTWGNGIIAFAAFSFCASAVYVINDFFDVSADRRHSIKKFRPIASGQVSLRTAILAVPVLLAFAASMCAFLPGSFSLVLGGYFLLTMAYTVRIKKMLILDTVVLALLYAIRIIGGSFATGIVATSWLLVFSIFFFYSLAMIKRYAELLNSQEVETRGRGYISGDLSATGTIGIGSGLLSVLVFLLYTQSDSVTVLYRHPNYLWMGSLCLIYWICRIWMLAYRGDVNEDPIVFAVRDPASYFSVVFLFLAMLTAY